MSGPAMRDRALIDDKYQLLDTIGVGGMSVVWLARDRRLGKLWAIKQIRPNEGGSRGEIMRQALVDEAHLMKRLDHPAIPRVVDIVETGASTYVVMDYVEGCSLAQLLRERQEPFDQRQVIDWGIQLCDVLGYLHGLSPALVYRDMKPANVMLRDDGTVRLIDFGITLVCEKGTGGDGRIVGTPGYAAPEQLGLLGGEPDNTELPAMQTKDDLHVDARADVYALGMTLYTLVTGHRPRRIDVGGETAQVSFDTRPIRDWNPRLSEGLELVLLRATCSDPAERYASVAEMRYDLEHYGELTAAWREAQQRKVRRLRLKLACAVACFLVGASCMLGTRLARTASYDDRLQAASASPLKTQGDKPSQAESHLLDAVRIDPSRPEAYEALLDVYEDDYVLTRSEEKRLRTAFGTSREIGDSGSYARLCFDVGICYLCYFGVDQGGGSVGNAAIASVEGAAPWFRRAVESSESDGEGGLSPQDVRAAQTYLLIAQFYDRVTRAGIEGTSNTEAYTELWEALVQALRREIEAAPAQRSAEGVRARLCQVAGEALASPTYLSGFARAGVSEEQARELLFLTSECADDLSSFADAEEYRAVYAPLFSEIRNSLELAQTSIQSVYHNPVARLEEAL